MLSIGAFARVGQVTHRMLRHWDVEGLLVPAHVDTTTGYRSYDPAQLDRLHRIVALRGLGFGIDDVRRLLDGADQVDVIAGLLRTRRAEVEHERRLAAERLDDVERRLHLIEREHVMSTIETIEKPLPAVRLIAEHAELPDLQHMTEETIGGLFDAARATVESATDRCGSLATAIATYDMAESAVLVVAGYEATDAATAAIANETLPAVDRAICAVHLGPVSGIRSAWQALHAAIVERGLEPSGPNRELYLRAESDDQQDWVTELQQPVRVAG